MTLSEIESFTYVQITPKMPHFAPLCGSQSITSGSNNMSKMKYKGDMGTKLLFVQNYENPLMTLLHSTDEYLMNIYFTSTFVFFYLSTVL